jgi:hypothetical protein
MKSSVLLTIVILFASAAQAQTKHYYFAKPNVGSLTDIWHFKVTHCAGIEDQKYEGLKPKCKTEGKHEVCTTDETMSARNPANGVTQEFPKVLIVFESQAMCRKGRADHLSSAYE